MSKPVIQRPARMILLFAALVLVTVSTAYLCWFFLLAERISTASIVGLVGALCAVGITRWYRQSDTIWFAELVVLLALGTLFIALLLPALQATRSRRRPECATHLKQIAIALHDYHDTFKSFPSAYISDSQGTALHSWRVLLLPFEEQQELFRQYDFNSAWNSTSNLPLAASCPRLYRCPQSADPKSDTNYLAVVGSETAWPGNAPAAFSDIRDGTSNTIAIVESRQTGINWTEPRDLTFKDMLWQINGDAQGSKVSSPHPGGAYAALVDGSIRFIPETIDPEVLRALITAQGGEPLDGNSW